MTALSSYNQYYRLRPTMLYRPPMMVFNGSAYYTDTFGTSGNKQTALLQFARASFSGGGREALINIRSASNNRLVIWINSNDYATADQRDKITVYAQNSASGDALILTSLTSWADGEPHGLFLEYDADAGTAELVIGGVADINAAQASHLISTTTLSTSSAAHYIGCRSGPTDYFNGQLGFVGYMNAGGLNWADFMDGAGNPIQQDTAVWANSGFGAQPSLFNEYGAADNNKGSSGDWTKNGTIDMADMVDLYAEITG